tara:strand:- start:1195 stop:1392 length:198 start_codon:yes stop_codon:yes gene_type:complete
MDMMFEYSIVILCFVALSIGFVIGMFYANISFIRYRKTKDSITRTKVESEWNESFKNYKEWIAKK